jgi:hypothetical protein
VKADGTLVATVPRDVLPGEHRVLLMLENAAVAGALAPLELPVHHVGAWPNLSLRREDLYDDDGR